MSRHSWLRRDLWWFKYLNLWKMQLMIKNKYSSWPWWIFQCVKTWGLNYHKTCPMFFPYSTYTGSCWDDHGLTDHSHTSGPSTVLLASKLQASHNKKFDGWFVDIRLRWLCLVFYSLSTSKNNVTMRGDRGTSSSCQTLIGRPFCLLCVLSSPITLFFSMHVKVQVQHLKLCMDWRLHKVVK